MAIDVVTLNIEADKHIARWLPVVKALAPQVLCLQELFEVDCEKIGKTLGMHWVYAPTALMEKENNYRMPLKGKWGVGLFSMFPLENVIIEYYSEDSQLRVFQEPNDPRRAVIIADVVDGEKRYRIATTHFTWSPRGETTDLQRQDFARLQPILNRYQDLILCGDFNAPRGRELFSLFEAHYKDNVPKDITTTIDPSLHYAGDQNLQLVVDTIFTTPEYLVKDCKVLEGLSDHKGVWAKIEKTGQSI